MLHCFKKSTNKYYAVILCFQHVLFGHIFFPLPLLDIPFYMTDKRFLWIVSVWIMTINLALARHGKYTHNPQEYHTIVPRKVRADGSLLSFHLPSFHEGDDPSGGGGGGLSGGGGGSGGGGVGEAGGGPRRTRSAGPGTEVPPSLHYALPLGGDDVILELWPNQLLLSPAAVVERISEGGHSRTPAGGGRCHWAGRVRGVPASRVALSACEGGLAGAVHRGGALWLLEPAAGARTDAQGRRRHIAFKAEHALRTRRRRRRRAEGAYGGGIKSCDGGMGGEGSAGGAFCAAGRWREAWAERFRQELRRNPHFLRQRRQAEVAGEGEQPGVFTARRAKRFLELLVVADKRFIDYHKEDAENYLLTIINIANDLWSDASTGRYFVLTITRLIMLEKDLESTDLLISPDAGPVLESFSRWAYKINPKDVQHPNRHDIAVLVTRYDICSDNMTNCNLLGLANMAQACAPEKSACINEDAGLIAGVTAAHEIGHVMGADHDLGGNPLDPTGCPLKDETGAGWVMTAVLSFRTGVWSNCSRAFFEKFLDSGLGDCLLDEPPEHTIKLPEVLPGVLYNADQQCKIYMNLDKQCDWNKDEVCKQLWCEKGDSCVSEGKPAAAGTACGLRRWCWGERCVAAGQRPQAVDGQWGAWGPWGACSRTCGAGVEARVRLCNAPRPQHRGRNCIGDARQFRVCNIAPCDPAAPSFLEAQCSAFDAKPWRADGRTHTWRPARVAMAPGDECRLLCANELNVYDALAQMVADGTPCRTGARDICVQGACRRVGCDWVLLSEIVEDVCGVCGGNGSLCRMQETLFTKTASGYTKVLEVPAGAHNLRVEELKSADNLVAIADKSGQTFYLSGDNTQYADGEYDFGGVKGVYTNPEKNRELVTIKGPLPQPLSVYYAFFGKPVNPGLRITWFEQKTGASSDREDAGRYRWEYVEWQACDARCGGGAQISVPECVESKLGKVSATFCKRRKKPQIITRKCNEQPCQARWVVGLWGPCSGCVFRSGVQRRQVECMRDNSHPQGDPVLLPDNACAAPRPLEMCLCNNRARCTDLMRRNAMSWGDRRFVADTNSEGRLAAPIPTPALYTAPSPLHDPSSVPNPAPASCPASTSVVTSISGPAPSSCTSPTPTPASCLSPSPAPASCPSPSPAPVSCPSPSPAPVSIPTPTTTPAQQISESSPIIGGKDCSHLVLDTFPEELLLVMEVPTMNKYQNATLSEEKEKEMGDELGSKGLNTSVETVVKGAKALEKLKSIRGQGEELRAAPRAS